MGLLERYKWALKNTLGCGLLSVSDQPQWLHHFELQTKKDSTYLLKLYRQACFSIQKQEELMMKNDGSQ